MGVPLSTTRRIRTRIKCEANPKHEHNNQSAGSYRTKIQSNTTPLHVLHHETKTAPHARTWAETLVQHKRQSETKSKRTNKPQPDRNSNPS